MQSINSFQSLKTSLLFFFILFFGCCSAHAAEFTADLLVTSPEFEIVYDLKVKDNMYRIQKVKGLEYMPSFPTIYNRSNDIAWGLNPQVKQYVEQADPAKTMMMNPVAGWEFMRKNLEVTPTGKETIQSYSCQVFEFRQKGETRVSNRVWVSSELGFALQEISYALNGNTTLALNNIKINSVDPAFFKIPSGYTKIVIGKSAKKNDKAAGSGQPMQVSNEDKQGHASSALASNQSIVSLSSGALLIEKAPAYDFSWRSFWIMDENPRTGWCCTKGKILNNVMIIELAEKSVFESLEFDTGHIDGKGRGAKDIIVELSDESPAEEFVKIASVSLVDKEDNQSFPVTIDKSGKWVRLTIQNNHGSSEYTELMEFRAFGKQLTKTPFPDFSGTYKTNFSNFHFRKQATAVTGCYEYKEGLFNGEIEGRIMKFSWRETKKKGPAIIIFTSDGEKFFGLWWYEGQESRPGQIWEGIKISQNVGGCPHWEGGVQEQMTKDLLESGRVRLYGINFDVDSDIIRSESKPTLDKIVAMLKSEKTMQLIIEGHTDSDGSAEHNQILSQQRSKSVKVYLVSGGISSSRLFTKGYGESTPVAPNNTVAGKTQNRRVELVVKK